MQESRDLYYIAALIDGEMNNSSEEGKLRQEIEKNSGLEFEYNVQSFIKSLVSEKLKISPAQVKVKKKLKRRIISESKSGFIAGSFPGVYTTSPLTAWGSTIFIILAILLLIFNRTPQPEYKNFEGEQSGSYNIFIQSKGYFENLLTGKLSLHLNPDNPLEAKLYFKEQNVAYSIYIPDLKNWKLHSVFVSAVHGLELAHLVYKNVAGQIMYMFQVDETELIRNKFITLTDDLISYLNAGNCYRSVEKNPSVLMIKIKENIFVIVSNESLEEIENNLCKTK